MPAIDELQLVANARARMLMRGYEPLRIEIGTEMNRLLADHIAPDGQLLEMDVRVRTDMEGFAVRPGS